MNVVVTYESAEYIKSCNPGNYKTLNPIIGVFQGEVNRKGNPNNYPILEHALQKMNAIAGVELTRIAVVNGLNLYSVVPLVLD